MIQVSLWKRVLLEIMFYRWDESEDKFIVGTTTATASDTGNLSITTGTLVGNIEEM